MKLTENFSKSEFDSRDGAEMTGGVLINTTTDNGVDKLQVNGSISSSLGYKSDRGISVKAPANVFGGYNNGSEFGVITEIPTDINAYWITSGRNADNSFKVLFF